MHVATWMSLNVSMPSEASQSLSSPHTSCLKQSGSHSGGFQGLGAGTALVEGAAGAGAWRGGEVAASAAWRLQGGWSRAGGGDAGEASGGRGGHL